MEELKRILEGIKEQVDYEKETELLTAGILDSVELVELIAAIEEKFQVEVPLDDMTPENFDSITAIWDMIQRL